MALSSTALVTLTEAKQHLRIDVETNLRIDAEFVGTGDGSDTTFDLDNTPVSGSLQLYVNNVLQVETTDYSLSTATITFVTAPGNGLPITASYDKTASSNTFASYEDSLIEALIDAATKKAEEYTGRAFIQRSITEYHTGEGYAFWLNKQPVDSVTSVVKEINEAVGTGDGSTVAFTLKEVPTSDSLTVYIDGVQQTVTTDYTLSGAVVTFVSAPSADEKITAVYTHTILNINEYTVRMPVGRLAGTWAKGIQYKVVYVAGYAATRAATQALIPDIVSAVLLMVAYLYENRVDMLHGESTSGISSVTYELPLYTQLSGAMTILAPYRTAI